VSERGGDEATVLFDELRRSPSAHRTSEIEQELEALGCAGTVCVLTVDEVAVALGWAAKDVRRLVKRGQLGHVEGLDAGAKSWQWRISPAGLRSFQAWQRERRSA
jgi:hypothetical protein